MDTLLALLPLACLAAAVVWVVRKRKAKKGADSSALPLALLPAEFVVFDLETTGLDPSRDAIIEIGAILYNKASLSNGKLDATTFQALVDPGRPIPSKIVQLTGITDAMVRADGVPPNRALQEFADFIGSHRLVAFNADFDLSFLRAAGLDVSNPTSCALRMSRAAWPGRRSYKLQDLAHSVQTGATHRALADCQKALIVYVGAVKALGRVE